MAIARSSSERATRLGVLAMLVIVAFFASYGYAVSRTGGSSSGSGSDGGFGTFQAGSPNGAAGDPASAGCACCGGGSSEPVEGSTEVAGDVQRIAIDTSSGGYSPNVVRAKAGVPMEISFGQASGCLAQVVFPDFQVFEDLTAGPKTITLPALEPGEYQFYCGMQMVFGKIVVE